MQRPEHFKLNRYSHLAQGLVFAGLGGLPGTTLYADASGYGNHGTLTSMDPPTDWVWVPELNRWGLDFDGSNDFISCSVSLAMPFTFAVWFAPIVSGTCYAFSLNEPGDTDRQYYLGTRTGDGTLYTFAVRYDGSFDLCNSTTAVALSTYVHVVGVSNATNSRLIYINGNNENSDTTDIAHPVVTTFDIGRLGDSSPTAAGKQFRAADALIYNRALSSAEIQQLADPSNVMLSGLILPPRRKWWPVVGGEVPPATIIPRIMHHRRLMGVS